MTANRFMTLDGKESVGRPDGRWLATLSKPERCELWAEIINRTKTAVMLELGVWKGDFAEYILRHCPTVTRYYMLDPWMHLDRWNKPANVEQSLFDDIYAEATRRTDFAASRRVILRGATTEVIEKIPDGSLDFAYIDGDHTLRGISIDLIRTYAKVRAGGILGGDDYTPTIWQHASGFEPSLVCPFAFYFAEAMGAPLVIYPQNQFAFVKPEDFGGRFELFDTTGQYGEPALLPQVRRPLWAHQSRFIRRLTRPFVRQPFARRNGR